MTITQKIMAHERAWSNRRTAEYLLRGKPTAFAKKMAAAKFALADKIDAEIKAAA